MEFQGANGPVSLPECPRLNEDEPPIGGVLKATCEDFVVDEIPLYPPSGQGEHLILHVQKRDVSGPELRRRLAHGLGIDQDSIGIAGMKDRVAVTRQYVSVPRAAESMIDNFADPEVSILAAVAHDNKIKTGHLAGNRFCIVLRDIDQIDQAQLDRIAARVVRVGCPNYYGSQRFGNHGETVQIGLDLLNGAVPFNRIRRKRGPQFARLALSAVQSGIFNQVLRDRLTAGRLDQVFAGDVVQLPGRFSTRLIRDLETDREWVDSGDWVLSGPIPGQRMRRPEGLPREWEQEAMRAFQVSDEQFLQFKRLTPGSRRPLIVRPEELSIRPDSAERTIEFRFTLPAGSYATVLLREFQGPEVEPES